MSNIFDIRLLFIAFSFVLEYYNTKSEVLHYDTF